MNKLVGLTVVAFAILLSVAAEPTSAQSPYLGGGCYGHFGYSSFGIMGSPYSLGQIPVPPYFALHPPVYYSQPVPRTYGYTPFAYPGTKETPELISPQAAKVIKNPYIEPASKDAALNTNTTAQVQAPRELLNPYAASKTRLASYK